MIPSTQEYSSDCYSDADQENATEISAAALTIECGDELVTFGFKKEKDND